MIIGHIKERGFLRRIAESESPLQSYIFSGPEKIGKFLVAKEFADRLASGSAIDVRIIEPEQEEKSGVTKKATIPVETIRELRMFLSSYPSQGNFRIAIIRDAHALTESAQNALLKTLEDPVESAIVILLTHEPGRILGTVRSRCQSVSFEPVDESLIASGMRELFPEGVTVELFFFSLGRPGLPIEAARDMSGFEKKKTLLRKLFLLSSLPVVERLALSEQFGKNVPQSIELCEWYLLGVRQQLRKGGDALAIREKLLFLDRLSSVLSALKSSQANARLAFDTLFLSA